ncbi:hypothetical protein MRX96_000924 [Rhipicephalus microplus]
MCRCAPTVRHIWLNKTLAHIKERFWWQRMHRDISRYVLSCTVCQGRKATTNPAQPVPVQPIPPPETPFKILGLDHLGPFPRTSGGSKFLIVAVDHGSRTI